MGRLLAILSILAAAGTARAEAPTPAAPSTEIKVGPDRKVTAYKLETVELRGSTRMTGEQLARELGLVAGTPLDDELVMTTRSKLLGLGLFKSAILVMRKGSKPGHARLIVEVEDDEGVLTDWALGGELGVTVNESSASSVEANTAPMDYRLGLVARNLAADLHRGSAWVDIDDDGNFRQGQLAYGLPRFALEDVQFDAELAAVSVRHRYLDALGFGGRGQGLWSRTLGSQGEVQYGAAMYTNKKKSEFASPGFPRSVVGPKVAYWRETRLRSFFPGAGSLIGASLLFAPTRSDQSVLELTLARTWSFSDWVYLTLDGRLLSVGVRDYAMRAEGRFDVPLGHAKADEDQAEIFLRLRGGADKATYDEAELRNEGREGSGEDSVALEGSAAIIGVRYHSSGFIAEFGIKVTRSPEELRPKALGGEESPLTRLRSMERWEGGEL
jgi:hypothetical protein